ncbi:MAG TPA: ABC transporter permease subunit [Virgibacillus sp.]|nr:ABC transporter permease subunit [Virgibacillus sp.]
MFKRPFYRTVMFTLGLPVFIFIYIYFLIEKIKQKDAYRTVEKEAEKRLLVTNFRDQLKEDYSDQLRQKMKFFDEKEMSQKAFQQQVDLWVEEEFNKRLQEETMHDMEKQRETKVTLQMVFSRLLSSPLFLMITAIPGILMYLFILIFSNPYLKYLFDRLMMTVFVVIGVIIFVFTILYFSPFDPAANIIGETATKEQIDAFNHLHGLDQSYFIQLWDAIKGIATFDLGQSFEGNENVAASIAKRFPITLQLTIISLFLAILIAIPVGIISATRPNSFLDYTFMFIALIGLSIPNFWQGLIFILGFSIKLKWLPATFHPGDWLSMIMPIIVLGTALTASVARMTRSSMLEIINEDYITTAKSKGLSQSSVLWRHAIGNAMIPIITVIGLLFGGMLGGAAVTEKVFNISGIGAYIVDKQFIPDIPSIMGGVVYVAITISLVNVIIDITYAFFDPRIRSKMKEY